MEWKFKKTKNMRYCVFRKSRIANLYTYVDTREEAIKLRKKLNDALGRKDE